MRKLNNVRSTLLQLGGTNVPPSAEKSIEDDIVGSCFDVALLFVIVNGAVILGLFYFLNSLLK